MKNKFFKKYKPSIKDCPKIPEKLTPYEMKLRNKYEKKLEKEEIKVAH